jgi:hypothetical protein
MLVLFWSKTGSLNEIPNGFDGAFSSLLFWMRPVEHRSYAAEKHPDTRPFALCYLGAQCVQERFNVSPGKIGAHWTVEDGLRVPSCFLLINQLICLRLTRVWQRKPISYSIN